MNSRSTPRIPATVAVITGKMASKTIMAILEASYTPSHKMITGRNATFGIGNPIETIGSKNQRAMVLREIAMAMKTPPTAATAKPANVR